MNDETIEYIHLYTSEEKIKWFGYGEWVEEADEAHFIYKDLMCKVIRINGPNHVFGGYLCGYVGINMNSPTFSEEVLSKLEDEIDCHGGVTFRRLATDNIYWLGFDCTHSGDYNPSIDKKTNKSFSERIFTIPEKFKDFSLFNPVYRNMNYCIEQCKYMVDQIIDFLSEKHEPKER